MKNEIRADVCALMTRELSFLRFMEDSEIAELSHHFTCWNVPANTVLWKQGEPCEITGNECGYVAFITNGEIKMSVETEFAGRGIVIGVFGRGSVIGELCVLDGSAREATATAMGDVDLVILSSDNFHLLLEEHQALAIKLLSGMLLSVSGRLRNSLERLATVF